MKKIILSFIFAICLILPFSFILSGCGTTELKDDKNNYLVTYDYGSAKSLFKTNQEDEKINPSVWITTLPEIKDNYSEAFLGWYIANTDIEIENYDFIGGDVTLEARFDIEEDVPSGLYQNGKYVKTWAELKEDNIIRCSNGAIFRADYVEKLSGALVIDNEVITINDSVFYDFDNLTDIKFPNTVTKIGTSAFECCSNLANIRMSSNIEYVGTSAFGSCGNLIFNEENGIKYLGNNDNKYLILFDGENATNLEINNQTRIIRGHAFYQSENITDVIIPDSVIQIGEGAFAECDNLENVTISKNVKYLTSRAFEDCGNLNSLIVDDENEWFDSRDNCNAIIETSTNTLIIGCNNTVIPNGIVKIGSAFTGLNSLESITIPSSVTNISGGSFRGCRLKTIIVETGNTKYDSRNNCNAIIETATNKLIVGCKTTMIPETVSEIVSYAFADVFNNIELIIPTSVTKLSSTSFYNCSGKLLYKGNEQGWDNIVEEYSHFIGITIYFYSEEEPTSEGNYWHYLADGTTPTYW